MKKYLIAIMLLISFSLFAQNNKVNATFNIGLTYAPTLHNNGTGEFKALKQTHTPLLSLSIGLDDFQVYFRSGERLEFGFISGNEYIFGGLGYIFDYNAVSNLKNSVFIEIGFPFKVSDRLKVLVSSRHGVTVKESLYFFSPINATLIFKLNK